MLRGLLPRLQFKELRIISYYLEVRKQLRALKDQGVVALARVEREMLIKASEGLGGPGSRHKGGRVGLALPREVARGSRVPFAAGSSVPASVHQYGVLRVLWAAAAALGLQVIQDFKVQLQEDFAAHQQQLAREAEERARARAKLEAQVGWGRDVGGGGSTGGLNRSGGQARSGTWAPRTKAGGRGWLARGGYQLGRSVDCHAKSSRRRPGRRVFATRIIPSLACLVPFRTNLLTGSDCC